jgi:hemerythrin-like domain-containing protein
MLKSRDCPDLIEEEPNMYIDAPEGRKPVGVLMIEHRLIERALDILESRINKPDAKPDVIAFARIIDFFGTYADATHHGKEEDILFLEADKKKLSPESMTLLEDLRREHIQFRKYRSTMEKSNREIADGNAGAASVLYSTAREFIPLLRQHIIKEDKIFFPAFNALQHDEERKAMLESFKAFDAERIHETYRLLVEKYKQD